MPIAVTEEQDGMQASIRDWAARAHPLALVRRLEPGTPLPDAADGPAQTPDLGPRWSELAALGVFSIALPTARSGTTSRRCTATGWARSAAM